MRASFLGMVFFALGVAPAAAQQDVCVRQGTGQIDQQATARWREMVNSADPRIMQALSGVWYSETRAPTGQVAYTYFTYEPNGLYQYSQRVCGGMNMCSDFAGHGLFAARSAGGNGFMGMVVVSDLQRDRLCTGLNGRFIDAQTFQSADGAYARKVR